MKNQIFKTTNSDFVSFLRVKKIPVIKAEKINFRQVAFLFEDLAGKISSLWEQWDLNPTKEMQLIQDFVVKKDSILKTIKIKMKNDDYNGGFYDEQKR